MASHPRPRSVATLGVAAAAALALALPAPASVGAVASAGRASGAAGDNRFSVQSLVADRRKLRDALANVRSFDGMIGPISINPESHPTKPREAEKELFLLQVKDGQWTTLLSPAGFRRN